MALQMVMQITVLVLVLIYGLAEAAVQPDAGCPKVCGNVTISFPFGIGSQCYLDELFAINCTDGKAIISRINLEMLDFKVEYLSYIQVKSPIISSNCWKTETGTVVDITGSPFYFASGNVFTAVGCNNNATMIRTDPAVGCTSYCNTSCEMSIPPYLQIFNARLKRVTEQGGDKCKMAFLRQNLFFSDDTVALLEYIRINDTSIIQNRSYVPVALLELAIPNGINDSSAMRNLIEASSGKKVACYNISDSTFSCYCKNGYEGNPYISTGCEDINECQRQSYGCPKFLTCKNTEGSYSCSRKIFIVIIVVSTSLGVIVLLIAAWWLNKVIKKRNENKLKKKFFKRNGGFLLEQQLSSNDDNVQNIKIFNSRELEKATDNFNESRILGRGGQGTVYKGMLVDGRTVAIKKSRIVDEPNLEQFVNEVVILSQVNHRNVVKLLGCCLEVEAPLLVYEFIPNGTLFQYLLDQNEEFRPTWNMRIRIATEVAGAVSYLHSAVSLPIYHRDIKSTNILLDDKYMAKVADFGTSRSVTIDQTHLTTLVHGTFGYLDPEYFHTSQFTEKSDVYSFGVVLVELLTGEKPVSFTRSQEGRSLATYFILSFEENHLFDILDARIINEDNKGEIMTVANLAKRCLSLSGKKRPTMREVTMELEGIQKGLNVQQNCDEFEYVKTGENEPWDVVSTSTGSSLASGIVSSTCLTTTIFSNTVINKNVSYCNILFYFMLKTFSVLS